MIYGPWADQSGRKPPIYLGVTLLLIGSAGAAMATTLESLVAWRIVQGFGGAAVMVVPRAIIRDLYTGAQATKLMAMVTVPETFVTLVLSTLPTTLTATEFVVTSITVLPMAMPIKLTVMATAWETFVTPVPLTP